MTFRTTVSVRPAHVDDAPLVQALLLELGYQADNDEVRDRLEMLAGLPCDPVLLALDANQVPLGLIALHWTPMLQIPGQRARITALVVREEARGQGAGRILVDAGAELAKAAGCKSLELTTAMHRSEAHAFYQAIGFKQTAIQFARSLD